jgi:thiamine pyrophosphokinase
LWLVSKYTINGAMVSDIVQTLDKVTLLGASCVSDAVLRESLRLAPLLVAADGGARVAINRGVMPQAVIGDLDSLDDQTRAVIPADRLHLIGEQDSTDFEKALSRINAPLVLAVGFTGQRLDHELAVYSSLVRYGHRPVIVVGDHDICFVSPKTLSMPLPVGTRVSLFPMNEVTCASTGLRWPTDGLVFAPWGRVGTSNESAADPLTLTPSAPCLLVILPRAHLEIAIGALLDGL